MLKRSKITTDRRDGRQYRLVKVYVEPSEPAKFQEASTGRRYNLVKVYV